MMRIFVFFFVLVNMCVSCLAGGIIAGDFDGDGQVTLKDIAYYMAWISKNRTTNVDSVLTEATRLYAPATGPIVRLPSAASDAFTGNDLPGLSDVAIMMGWISKNRTNNFNVVLTESAALFSGVKNIYKLPATPVGDSSFSTTIDGITAD